MKHHQLKLVLLIAATIHQVLTMSLISNATTVQKDEQFTLLCNMSGLDPGPKYQVEFAISREVVNTQYRMIGYFSFKEDNRKLVWNAYLNPDVIGAGQVNSSPFPNYVVNIEPITDNAAGIYRCILRSLLTADTNIVVGEAFWNASALVESTTAQSSTTIETTSPNSAQCFNAVMIAAIIVIISLIIN